MKLQTVALLYHDVYAEEGPRSSGFARPSSDAYKLERAHFEQHLDQVAAELKGPMVDGGWLADLRAHPDGVPTLLTFDDGGVSAHTVIAPMLEARGWRGLFFVATDFIGSPGFLSEEQIADLDARGHVIGSHSCSHPPKISDCSEAELRHEWGESRRRLEAIVGHEVSVASIPGGFYAPAVARVAAEEGLTLLFTSAPVRAAWQVGSCTLFGRFPIMGTTPARVAGEYAGQQRLRMGRELAFWRAKNAAKACLGPIYPWLRRTYYGRRRP